MLPWAALVSIEAVDRTGKDFARQGHINGSAWLARCQGNSSINGYLNLIWHISFVIPFHYLAKHRGLVEHFLTPMAVNAPGAMVSFLREGGAPGGDQHWDAISCSV